MKRIEKPAGIFKPNLIHGLSILEGLNNPVRFGKCPVVWGELLIRLFVDLLVR